MPLRPSRPCASIAHVIAALAWFVGNAAEEGRDVILSMLVVGLVFIGVIALGEAVHYAAVKRKEAQRNRPL